MDVIATLGPKNHIAQNWKASRFISGVLHGATFKREGDSWVCKDIPPGRLAQVMADPLIKITLKGVAPVVGTIGEPVMPPAAKAAPATPPAAAPEEDLDPASELEAMLSGRVPAPVKRPRKGK